MEGALQFARGFGEDDAEALREAGYEPLAGPIHSEENAFDRLASELQRLRLALRSEGAEVPDFDALIPVGYDVGHEAAWTDAEVDRIIGEARELAAAAREAAAKK